MTTVWNVLGVIGIIVLIYGAQLYIRQWSIVFRPSREIYGTPSELHIEYKDIYLAGPRHKRIHAWWMKQDGAANAVIFFHGTVGNVSYDLRTIYYLYSLGMSVLLVDYPGYGKSDGKPSQRGCFEAADAAWNYLCENEGYCGDQIVLHGRSLGSAVATYLAAKNSCKGLVFQSGFTSIPDMAALLYPFLPVRWFCHTNMSAIKLIGKCQCPVLVIHSVTDEFIPIRFAEQVYEQAKAPKKFVRIQGAHFSNQWQADPQVRRNWQAMLSGESSRWCHS